MSRSTVDFDSHGLPSEEGLEKGLDQSVGNRLRTRPWTNPLNSRNSLSSLIVALLLVLVAMATRWGSLKVGFLADDLLCVDYLHKIFNGHPELFLQRMVSAWQDPHVQLMYRPFADVTLCFDFLIWKTQAGGFHLSNLIVHAGCVVALYLLCKQILPQDPDSKIHWTATSAALLFALNPLFTEAVVWVVGRMDLLCGLFVLTSLGLYTHSFSYPERSRKAKLFFALSLAAFLPALGSKELSVIFPVLLFCTRMFLPDLFDPSRSQSPQNPSSDSSRNSLRSIFSSIVPFGVLTAAFLLLRTMVIGTFPGGYKGSYGGALMESMLVRLTHKPSLERIILPLHEDLFPPESLEAILLRALYMVAAVTIVLRIPLLPWNSPTMRVMCWSLICALLCFLPAAQIYAVNNSLSGARILYLPGAFVCIAVVAALYPMFEASGQRFCREFRTAAIALTFGYAMIFSVLSHQMVNVWQQATKILQAFGAQVNEAALALPSDKRLVVLNPPGEHFGAYQLFRFEEIQTLVSAAFFKKGAESKLASTDIYPVLTPTSCQRLAELARDGRHKIVWFDPQELKLMPVGEQLWRWSESSNKPPVVRRLDTAGQEEDAQYLVTLKPVPAILSSAELKVGLEISGKKSAVNFMKWLDVDSGPMKSDVTKVWCSTIFSDAVRRDVYAPLCDIPQRLPAMPAQFRVLLRLPGVGYEHKLSSVELKSPDSKPLLNFDVKSLQQSDIKADGSCIVRDSNKMASVFIDASAVPGAKSVLVEISGCDLQFNSGRIRHQVGDKGRETAHSEIHNKLKFAQQLNVSQLKAGRYQLRACSLDEGGNLTGLFSDPLTFLVGCEN